jgi:recombination protein RecA
MPASQIVRAEIESSLAVRIPSALTPIPRIVRATSPTGIDAVDQLLEGGVPVGAITEIVGAECSGRTSLALSFIAEITHSAKVCAWIDVSNALHPEFAAAAGVDLQRLLWVRCGASTPSLIAQRPRGCFTIPEKYFVPAPVKRGLHGGGFGPHPRGEVKGMSEAIGSLLKPEAIAPRCAEPQRRVQPERAVFEVKAFQQNRCPDKPAPPGKPWVRIDQALRVVDLLLQGGGFSAVVLDMGSISPEDALRVPLAAWFRYRAAAERTQTSIVLITQHACAKSSAGLVLRLQQGIPSNEETTVFAGVEHRIEVVRERFKSAPSKITPLRKPPQPANEGGWQSRTAWVGRT